MNTFESATELMKEQLGHDVVIALATCMDKGVNVRTVNGYYKDGVVYVVTYTSSQICKDLMCAQGIGENLGNPKEEKNEALRKELREVFVAFYDRHINENDPGSCILKITLIADLSKCDTEGFVCSHL